MDYNVLQIANVVQFSSGEAAIGVDTVGTLQLRDNFRAEVNIQASSIVGCGSGGDTLVRRRVGFGMAGACEAPHSTRVLDPH